MSRQQSLARTASWASPGRVNLIGEHTDYNDGFCLPLAIAQSATVTVSARPQGGFSAHSAQLGSAVNVSDITAAELVPGMLADQDLWAGYVLGAVWALTAGGHRVRPLHLEIDSAVPVGAGLSSSAALECAAVAAVADFSEISLDRAEIVSVARRCENEFVGAPTGGMDQLASVFGEAGHVLLCDMRSMRVRPIPLPLDAAGLSLLVINSNAPHQLTDGQYAERRRSCEQACQLLGVAALRDVELVDLPAALGLLAADSDKRLLRRARHVVTENARTLQCAQLLQVGAIRDIGDLLTASHASLRDDFEVSVPEVDLAVQTMIDAGALGARITGGGFGGCAIGLIDSARVTSAIAAIERAFALARYNAPAGFTVLPCNGTHQI